MPTSHFIEADSLLLHYLDSGTPARGVPTTLLLHGFPTSSHLYRNILPVLAQTHRAVAVDLPGFGLSDKPLDATYDYEFFADSLDAFLDALGIDELSLCVHDLGGPVGLYWMLRHPGRVKKLVILNTLTYPETHWSVKLFLLAMKTPGVRDFLVSPRGLVGSMYLGVANRGVLNRDVLTPYTAPFATPAARKAFIKAGGSLGVRGLAKIARELPHYETSVRLIYGERDRILPDISKTMARLKHDLPGAEVTALPHCGHFLQEDDPERVARLMAEFLNREQRPADGRLAPTCDKTLPVNRPRPQIQPPRTRVDRLTAPDPLLAHYESVLLRRTYNTDAMKARLTESTSGLADFASGHEYFGLHLRDGEWILREWAPHATAIHLKGPFSDWKALPEYAFQRGDHGVWELRLGAEALAHEDPYRLEVAWHGGKGDRFPAWVRRVVRDPASGSFNAQVWEPSEPYVWRHERPRRSEGPLLVYETHVGMAQEEPKVGTYAEFERNVLPHVRDAGYGALQIMALAEHPYYASFGYQVSSFFAASSRFGTPEELKSLVDRAHELGLLVLMDLVHSHAVRNEVEGISRQDGTESLYFHEGPRGEHARWHSRCFDYGKPEVLHFLLSNCRYWMDEFRVDGFRFDGVTSMLYLDHGLDKSFTSYDDYFGDGVDEDALTYLTLANELVHELNPDCITVAEDVSGFPGLARPVDEGGAGFDYRYAMGISDHWIELIKETRDEDWSMGKLWYELNTRRPSEPTISYAESHDQALVGDQTLVFRLLGPLMYDKMSTHGEDLIVERGLALHKLIRLVTLGTAGDGYLNFMGNEFGHPEWIDFPREGNQWSYAYARRQWRLAKHEALRYRNLAAFDRDLMTLARTHGIPDGEDAYSLHIDEEAKVLAWLRGDLVFAACFHPTRSFPDYWIPAPPGVFRIVLDTDWREYGGFERRDPEQHHHTLSDRIERHYLSLYLPAGSAMVLQPIDESRS